MNLISQPYQRRGSRDSHTAIAVEPCVTQQHVFRCTAERTLGVVDQPLHGRFHIELDRCSNCFALSSPGAEHTGRILSAKPAHPVPAMTVIAWPSPDSAV